MKAENLALMAQLKLATKKLERYQVGSRFASIEEGFSSIHRTLDIISDCDDLVYPPTRFRGRSLVKRYSDLSGIDNIENVEANNVKGAPPPQIALERFFSCPL